MHDLNDIKELACNLACAYQIANDISDIKPWVKRIKATIPEDICNRTITLPIAWAAKEAKKRGHSNLIKFMRNQTKLDIVKTKSLFNEILLVEHFNREIFNYLNRAEMLMDKIYGDSEYAREFKYAAIVKWSAMYKMLRK